MASRLNLKIMAVLTALTLGACGGERDGAVEMAIVGDPDSLFEKGVRLSSAGQHVRAATADGLVGLDANGQVIPELAERWIVTDGGRSYIFRLRGGTWPDGSDLTGESARDAFRRSLRNLRGTAMALDLAVISEVRAMAGRVVEIRLSSPMPDFLQLLAQPELGLFRKGAAQGPMVLERDKQLAILSLTPPEMRGEAQVKDWQERTRKLHLRALPAAKAIALFDEGGVDVVLGGRIEDLPRVETGPLSRGTVRLDRVIGLFGLQVRTENGLFAEASLREAAAMAIDRDRLIGPFNVDGWRPTTRVVAPDLDGDLGTIGERWADLPIEQRQATAARRVAAWRADNGDALVQITLALPQGPGADIVFNALQGDLARAGFALRRAKKDEKADLIWVDQVIRYAAPAWFLNQFNCSLRRGLCSAEADARVAEALSAPDVASARALLAEAEAELTVANVFIPIGAPLRWSLVRGSVAGFEPNSWGFHPLPPLALRPK
jgi:oligopeptide transport system substrate-binding protein